jgi:hypothetical protein
MAAGSADYRRSSAAGVYSSAHDALAPKGESSSPSLPAPRNPQCPVAWEAVIGLATGALVQHANDVPVSERPAMADAIQSCKTTSSSVILASWRP